MAGFDLLGWFGAAAMGLVLGLIGGGGSILAVPVLVYLFGQPGGLATYYSLFIVGLSAAIAVVPYARRGGVEFATAGVFFLPSLLGVAISRRILLPALPPVVEFLGLSIAKDAIVLLGFGAVMLAASVSMIR